MSPGLPTSNHERPNLELFTYRGYDGPRGLELRKTVREQHLAHLQVLADQNRVRFGGPLLDQDGQPCGSLVVFEAPDLAAAQAIADADPYLVLGVFERVEVMATRAVFP